MWKVCAAQLKPHHIITCIHTCTNHTNTYIHAYVYIHTHTHTHICRAFRNVAPTHVGSICGRVETTPHNCARRKTKIVQYSHRIKELHHINIGLKINLSLSESESGRLSLSLRLTLSCPHSSRGSSTA
jgi:hypothetical protein